MTMTRGGPKYNYVGIVAHVKLRRASKELNKNREPILKIHMKILYLPPKPNYRLRYTFLKQKSRSATAHDRVSLVLHIKDLLLGRTGYLDTYQIHAIAIIKSTSHQCCFDFPCSFIHAIAIPFPLSAVLIFHTTL